MNMERAYIEPLYLIKPTKTLTNLYKTRGSYIRDFTVSYYCKFDLDIILRA